MLIASDFIPPRPKRCLMCKTKSKRTCGCQNGGESKSGLIPSGSTNGAEAKPVPPASLEYEN